MTQQLNYGIIGSGMMGQEHIRNINLLPNASIAAIFDPDPVMQKESLTLAPNARIVETVQDLLAIEDLDCLMIASPNDLHVPQMQTIARLRPLPVLLEKPACTNPNHVHKLEALNQTYPAPIWVAMEYRYMPPIQAFIERVQEATGGIKMLTIREHRFPFLGKVGHWNRFNNRTGGTLVEKCCHFFDLMRLVIGSEPTRIMASGAQDVNHLEEIYDGVMADVWDNAYVIVDFENGARAMLELCMFAEGSKYQEEITAVGPSGKIESLVPGPTRFWPDHLGDPPTPQIVISPRDPKGPQVIDVPVDPALLDAGDHNGATFYQHERFCEVVRGAGMPEVSLNDGIRSVDMGLAAQESVRTGRAITL